MSTLNRIDVLKAKALLESGKAVLVDIREDDEFAREHIPGAQHLPLSRFNGSGIPGLGSTGGIAIFHCASGARTAEAAPRLLGTGFTEMFQLEQGLAGWKQAGLATVLDRKAPISLQRQVQITAGTMILIGVVLGFALSPWFFALSGFVGAGLLFSGVSGTCAMAGLLAVMPWNRRTLAPTT